MIAPRKGITSTICFYYLFYGIEFILILKYTYHFAAILDIFWYIGYFFIEFVTVHSKPKEVLNVLKAYILEEASHIKIHLLK